MMDAALIRARHGTFLPSRRLKSTKASRTTTVS
jgi:hypothetical protein